MGGVIGRDLRPAHGHDLRPPFTASLIAFPALNDGDLEADIEIASPARRAHGRGRVLRDGDALARDEPVAIAASRVPSFKAVVRRIGSVPIGAVTH